jgi:hypothetical protein
MAREDFINKKNLAVKRVLGYMENDPDISSLNPKTYNELRNMLRFNFNWLLNEVFSYMHLEKVPLKREGNSNVTTRDNS